MLGVGESIRRSRWTQSVLAVAADMRIVARLMPRSTMSKDMGDVGVIGVWGIAAGHCHELATVLAAFLIFVSVLAVEGGSGVYAVDDGAVVKTVADVAACVEAGFSMGAMRGS